MNKDQAPQVVQVAVWRDHREMPDDIFGAYASHVFFDFSRPVRVFRQSIWDSKIDVRHDNGFFVMSLRSDRVS